MLPAAPWGEVPWPCGRGRSGGGRLDDAFKRSKLKTPDPAPTHGRPGKLFGWRPPGTGDRTRPLMRRARSAYGRRASLPFGATLRGSPAGADEGLRPLDPRQVRAPGGSPRAVARLPPRRGNSGSDAACDRHHVPQPGGMVRPHRAESGAGGGAASLTSAPTTGSVVGSSGAGSWGFEGGRRSPCQTAVFNTAWAGSPMRTGENRSGTLSTPTALRGRVPSRTLFRPDSR